MKTCLCLTIPSLPHTSLSRYIWLRRCVGSHKAFARTLATFAVCLLLTAPLAAQVQVPNRRMEGHSFTLTTPIHISNTLVAATGNSLIACNILVNKACGKNVAYRFNEINIKTPITK